MIELVLVFLFGMLVAGLIWLILLPAFWRRATRITRQRLERALPLSVNEIFAEQDRLRAEHGVAMARGEARQKAMRDALAAAKAETGARLTRESALVETIDAERGRISALEAEMAALRQEIAGRDSRIAALVDERDLALAGIAALETQRDALTARLTTTSDIAEKRRLALDEAQVRAERAREAHAEEAQRSAELRRELQVRGMDLREAERRLAGLENGAVLTRIRGGEETYQSSLGDDRQRQAG